MLRNKLEHGSTNTPYRKNMEEAVGLPSSYWQCHISDERQLTDKIHFAG